MSRLVINIEHTPDGKLAFGVQSDNADQQVAILQHQLANATIENDDLKQKAENADSEREQRLVMENELASAINREEALKEQNSQLRAQLAQAKVKKSPARRRR